MIIRPAARALQWWLALVLAAWLLTCSVAAIASDTPSAPRIGVVTMQPGEIFFERFGHDAIVVAEPGKTPVSYNFGYFDPSEPDFVGNFVRGQMMYYLVALPLEQDLAYYRDAGRGASIQWLALRDDQARALAAALAQRASGPEAHYRYDYFTANCATMVRDALDQAMGGALHAQLAGRSRGNSWRSESVRLASPSLWMWLGFDLGLGPSADVPLSRWQEAFVPMRLADSLREARNSDGQPLVSSEQALLPHHLAAEPVERARSWWPWLLLGLAAATAVLKLAARPRWLAIVSGVFWFTCAVAGGLLLYLWWGSAHTAAWGNRNLLLLNPLCVALLPTALALWRGKSPTAWQVTLQWLVAGIAAASLPLHWLSLQPQFNMQWIVLLLPLHLALAWLLHQRRRLLPPRH